MNSVKKTVGSAGLAAAIAVGALAVTAPAASAYVVCNASGECWRVHRHYNYAPEYGVTVYNDRWYGRHRYDRHYHWRSAREGRGYYRDGVWISF
jgi:hypothetical protein